MSIEKLGTSFRPEGDPGAKKEFDTELHVDGGRVILPRSRVEFIEASRDQISKIEEVGLALEVYDNFSPFIKYENRYHGRAAADQSEWSVDPDFNNKGNTTGNQNISGLSGIYLGNLSTAQEFARARSSDSYSNQNLSPEVHQLFSTDPESRVAILDLDKPSPTLSSEAIELRNRGIQEAIPRPGEIAIPPMVRERSANGSHREDWLAYKKEVQQYNFSGKYVQFAEFVNKNKKMLSFDSEADSFLDKHLKSCVNTIFCLMADHKFALRKLVNQRDQDDDYLYEKESNAPLNKEMIRQFAENLHIVGVEQNVYSATLGKTIRVTTAFDMDNLVTLEQAEKRSAQQEKLADFTKAAFGFLEADTLKNISPELTKQYADVSKMVEDFKQSLSDKYPNRPNPLEQSAGVWEGVTVAQHTETVLENFENNLANYYPAEALPLMRLLLLEHDIGKGVATDTNFSQKERNAGVSRQINRQIMGLTEEQNSLIWSIMGTGAELAAACFLEKDNKPAISEKMFEYAQDKVRPFCADEQDLNNFADAFIDLCASVYFCDASAYTTVSSTTIETEDDLVVRVSNHPSFNDSFVLNTYKKRIKMQ